jgi:hypothetical protein
MIYSLPFVFYYPCPPLFDCGTFCIAVSFSWYRFYRATHLLKVSWKGICIFIDFEVFLFYYFMHVFNFKKWHVPRNLPSFFFFVAVVVIDLPFSLSTTWLPQYHVNILSTLLSLTNYKWDVSFQRGRCGIGSPQGHVGVEGLAATLEINIIACPL